MRRAGTLRAVMTKRLWFVVMIVIPLIHAVPASADLLGDAKDALTTLSGFNFTTLKTTATNALGQVRQGAATLWTDAQQVATRARDDDQ